MGLRKHKTRMRALCAIILLAAVLAGCAKQPAASEPPGPIVTPTPPPPTAFAPESPTPPATEPVEYPLEPVFARAYGLESVRWMDGALPEGITVGQGMIAGLVTLRLEPEQQDYSPEQIVLMADSVQCDPQLYEVDPNGALSLWYAVPLSAEAIEVVLLGAEAVPYGSVPTPENLAVSSAYSPLGRILYTEASAPLLDLRTSPLLDAREFPTIPMLGRVVAVAEITHLSRSVSRIAIVDMPLEEETVSSLSAMADFDVREADENGFYMSGYVGDYILSVSTWENRTATGLSGILPNMEAKEGRCTVMIRLLAEGWNTEVGGDETRAIEGPKGEIRVARVTIEPQDAPEEVRPGPGEVVVAIDLEGGEAALTAAMARSDEAVMYFQSLESPCVASGTRTLYFSVPLLDGPDRLRWFGSAVELPMP